MKKISVIIALMLVSVLTAQNPQIQQLEQLVKQNPNDASLHLNLGKLQYQEVMKGEKSMLKPAIANLKKATKLDKENSNAFCWYGSSIVMKAKYALFPPMKVYYVFAGLAEMDKAVKLDENNVENRFIRGQTCLGIPSFFGRTKTALEDFTSLETMMTYAPDKFDNDDKASILYYLGKAYKANGDSEKADAYFARIKTDFSDTTIAGKL